MLYGNVGKRDVQATHHDLSIDDADVLKKCRRIIKIASD